MPAKRIAFDSDAARPFAGASGSSLAPSRSRSARRAATSSSEVLRRPHGHQGRRHGREGDRARGRLGEHGRPDGQGGRLEDLRRCRRRHHHRHGPRRGDLRARGIKLVAAGANPMAIKRGYRRRSSHGRQELKKLSKTVESTRRRSPQVGTISANNDTEIGELLADAMDRVGKDGVITVEEAKGIETELESSRACSSTRATSRPTS